MTGPSFSLVRCIVLAAALLALGPALAFVPHRSPSSLPSSIRQPRHDAFLIPSSAAFPNGPSISTKTTTASTSITTTTTLHASDKPVEITFPTPSDAASMGVRDWPQQFHGSSWTESVSEGAIATRYVLDGKGRVTIDYLDDNNRAQQIKKQRVYPGTLIEVDGEANLSWEVDNEKEGMIVLTPSYEEGGKLLLVGGFLAVFCAGLLFGSGGL